MTYNLLGDCMSSKDEFKAFVRSNPSLLAYVNEGNMTWQKFYEMYDLYGNNSSVWDKYLKDNKTSDLFTWIKNIDINKVEDGVNSIRRVLSVLSEVGNSTSSEVSSYTPRPLYRHFED